MQGVVPNPSISFLDTKLENKIDELVTKFEASSFLARNNPIDFRLNLKKIVFNCLSSENAKLDQTISLLFRTYFNTPSGAIETSRELREEWNRLLPILKKDADPLLARALSTPLITNWLFNNLIEFFKNNFEKLHASYNTPTDNTTQTLAEKCFLYYKKNSDTLIKPYLNEYLDENSPLKQPIQEIINLTSGLKDFEPVIKKLIGVFIDQQKTTIGNRCKEQIRILKLQATQDQIEVCSVLRTFVLNPIKEELKSSDIDPIKWAGTTNLLDEFIGDYVEAHALKVTLDFKKVLDSTKDEEKPHEFLYEFAKKTIDEGKKHLKKVKYLEEMEKIEKLLIPLKNLSKLKGRAISKLISQIQSLSKGLNPSKDKTLEWNEEAKELYKTLKSIQKKLEENNKDVKEEIEALEKQLKSKPLPKEGWSQQLSDSFIDLIQLKPLYPDFGQNLLESYAKEKIFPKLVEKMIDQIMDKTTLANAFVVLLKESDVVYDEALKLDYEEHLKKLSDLEIKLPDQLTIATLPPLIKTLEEFEIKFSETLEEGTPRYLATKQIIRHLEVLQDRIEQFIDFLKKNKPIPDNEKEKFNQEVEALKTSIGKQEVKFSNNKVFNLECMTFVQEFIKEVKNPIVTKALQVKKIKQLSAETVGTTIKEFLSKNTLSDLYDQGLKEAIPILKEKKIDPIKAEYLAKQAFKAEYIKKWHMVIDNLIRSIFSVPWHHFKRFIEKIIRLTFGFETSLDKILVWVEWIGEAIFQAIHLSVGTVFYLILDRILHFNATIVLDKLSNPKHKSWLISELDELLNRLKNQKNPVTV